MKNNSILKYGYLMKSLLLNEEEPIYGKYGIEYSCAVTPQVRQTGNRLSGLAGTAMRVYSRNVLSKP